MRVCYSISSGLILLPGKPGSEPAIFSVGGPIPDSPADNPSLLSLVSDWQETNAETLDSARVDVRTKYLRYWAAQLLGDLIIGLPAALECDTIKYLDDLLDTRVVPKEVIGELLQAPLARPESGRRLVAVADDLGCTAVALVLETTVELQPRLVALSGAWRRLSVEHFAALGRSPEELWRQLAHRGGILSLLEAADNAFIDCWLRTNDDVESITPSDQAILHAMGHDLAALFYEEPFETEFDPLTIGPGFGTKPFVSMVGKLRTYFQKHYEYSFQSTTWGGDARLVSRCHPPASAIEEVEPAVLFVPVRSKGLLRDAA